MYDYDEEDLVDYEDKCRQCRKDVSGTEETTRCHGCDSDVPSGRVTYACSCGNQWIIGRRQSHRWGDLTVCNACWSAEAGPCVLCGNRVSRRDSYFGDGVVCRLCADQQRKVWCPMCDCRFNQGGYLRAVFHADEPAFQAAALVTHYRHEHQSAHDKAWSNPSYAARIPGYQYEEYRSKANNQAKRQLLRAVRRRVQDGAYPEAAPIQAMCLVAGFAELQDNDEETDKLIEKVGQALRAGQGPSAP